MISRYQVVTPAPNGFMGCGMRKKRHASDLLARVDQFHQYSRSRGSASNLIGGCLCRPSTVVSCSGLPMVTLPAELARQHVMEQQLQCLLVAAAAL